MFAILKHIKNPAAIFKWQQIFNYSTLKSLKFPVKTQWRSTAACFYSIQENWLALQCTHLELSELDNINYPDKIGNIITNDEYWTEVNKLFCMLDNLVAGITMFESNTPCLALFYEWYKEQLESLGKY